jgi:hypothetical protein
MVHDTGKALKKNYTVYSGKKRKDKKKDSDALKNVNITHQAAIS